MWSLVMNCCYGHYFRQLHLSFPQTQVFSGELLEQNYVENQLLGYIYMYEISGKSGLNIGLIGSNRDADHECVI